MSRKAIYKLVLFLLALGFLLGLVSYSLAKLYFGRIWQPDTGPIVKTIHIDGTATRIPVPGRSKERKDSLTLP